MNQQVTNRDGDAQDGYGVVTEPGTVRFERLLPGPIERVCEPIGPFNRQDAVSDA